MATATARAARTDVARRLAVTVAAAAIAAALAGCSLFGEKAEAPLELDYNNTLPAGWEAIGSWQEVSIDNDDEPEYLLLFSYEAGQAGAAIYDAQIASPVVGIVEVAATPVPTPTVALIPVPLQPFGYYKPYRLLPSAWAFTYGDPAQVGHGYVAAPADSDNIVVTQVNYDGKQPQAGSMVTGTQSSPASPTGELVLRGGGTLLTFVWWKDALEGYGVTQVAASGGWQGIDWQAWDKKPTVIETFSGLYPVDDFRARSLLCRVVAYARAGSAPSIAYAERDMGIQFCPATIPAGPYYPEGVVLAYLLWAGTAAHAQDSNAKAVLLAPGVAAAQLDAEIGSERLPQEKVGDIVTYPTVAVTAEGLRSGSLAPTTTVCVELAELVDARYRRWLVFTLQYLPPDLQAKQADRWVITGASVAPAPVQEQPSYCTTILGQATAP